jgi:hypothetical protein
MEGEGGGQRSQDKRERWTVWVKVKALLPPKVSLS